MSNIFFLSTTDNLDTRLAEALSSEIRHRQNKVAYISSSPQANERPYYQSTIVDYRAINSDVQVDYFDLSEDFSDEVLLSMLGYGTIYLSGGNTFVFMEMARKRNLKALLSQHIDDNGLIVGASAGSIMLTPSIEIAIDEDENVPNLKDFTGFGFVDFEFYPHWLALSAQTEYLEKYSKGKANKMYVSKDSSGLFYSNGEIQLFGDISEFNT